MSGNIGVLRAMFQADGATKAAGEMDTFAKSADKAAKGVDNLNNRYTSSGAAASKFNSSFRTMGSSLSGIGRDSEALATRITGLGMAFGGLGFAASAIRLTETADKFNLLQKRVELMAGSTELGTAAFAQLYQTSQDVGAGIEATAGMFTRFNGVVLQMGGTQAQTLKLVDTLTKGLAVQGVSAREGTASLQQLAQALASGKLAGDEFRSMMENAPYLMQLLAKNLGVTTGELRKMSMESKLTSQVVMDSFLKASVKIGEDFEKIPMTAARGWEAFKNSFAANLDQFNDANNLTKTLGTALVIGSQQMDLVFGAAKVAGIGLFAAAVSKAGTAVTGKVGALVAASAAARAEAAATLQSTTASVADTAAKKAQAAATLQAAQAAAAQGLAGANVAKAQAASMAATSAHTVAINAQAVAQQRVASLASVAATATRGAGVVMAALGGPVTIAVAALTGLAWWWSNVADQATNAAQKQKEAAEKSAAAMAMIKAGENATGLAKQVQAEADAKSDLIKKQETLNKLLAEEDERKRRSWTTTKSLIDQSGSEEKRKFNIARAREQVALAKKTAEDMAKATQAAQTQVDAQTPKYKANESVVSPLLNSGYDQIAKQRKLGEAFKFEAQKGYKDRATTIEEGSKAYREEMVKAGASEADIQEAVALKEIQLGKKWDEARAAESKKAGAAGLKAAKLEDAYNTRMREELDIKAALAQENYALAKSESEYAEAKARNKDLADLKGLKVSATSPEGEKFLALRKENREAAQDADRAREQYKEQAKAVDDLAKAYADSYVALQGYNREQKMALDTKDMTEYQKSVYAVKLAMEELNEVRTKQIFGSDTDYKAAQNAAQDKVNKAQAGVGLAGVASLKETQDYVKTLPANLTDAAIAEENKRYADKLEALGLHGEGMLTLTEEQNAALEAEAVRHKTVIDGLKMNQYNGELTAFASFGDNMSGLISNMNANREKEDKKGLAAQKAFAISSAMINMYLGVSEGIKDGWPVGYIKAAAAAAAGMANVANIKSISASRGADLPNHTTNATLHAREMVLPRTLADKVRGMSDVNEMIKNDELGGKGGGGAVTIINQTTGRIDSVQETRLSNGEKALIIKETENRMVASLSDPNSAMSKGLQRNYNTQRSR